MKQCLVIQRQAKESMARGNCRKIQRKAGEIQIDMPKEAFLAADKLTYAGFRMWMFLISQPEEQQVNITYKLLKTYHIDINTIKRGINDLLNKGYLVEVEKDKYDFYAMPQMTDTVVKHLISQF